ncbi:hypothetical protein RND81_03G243000 [Saponaria officinalis]|uniref:SWI/SNF complex subunit SWI3C n=1 Tax=Saponaria officinalis TaxID=3572 RepID=A0AAW1MA75_SAPOF
MPGSPSDGRHKWKRSRGPKSTKRQRAEDEEDEDDDEENEEADEDEDLHPNPNPSPQITEVLSGSGIRISSFPPAIKYAVSSCKQHDANLVLENISFGQLQVLSAVPSDSPALVGPDHESSFLISPPPLFEGRPLVKPLWNKLLLLPLHADWFQPNAVHRLERQAVPHFFSGKSAQHTHEKYLDCRNSIIAKYLEYPLKRLSPGDCQKLAFGVDNEDIIRIFRFLDHWGIINFSAPTSTHDLSIVDSYLREEPTGEVHVPSTSLKSIDSLIKFDKPKCRLKPADLHSSLSSNCDALTDLDSRIRERLSEHHCNYCSRPLLLVYYQSTKEADTLLCPDCYHEGRLVVGHSSMDFTKVDTAAEYGDHDGDSWTNQETLLLLEALEIYNDNWNDIAEHVGTKSKSQCIIHFLRLPMEDGLFENLEIPCSSTLPNKSNTTDSGSMHVNANGHHGQDSENRFPFTTSENPVMSLVAFLASAVGPRIAAACAHACLAVLTEDEGSLYSNRVDSDTRPLKARNYCQQTENLGTQGSRNQEVSPIPCERVNSAAKAGLAAAAVKAKLFADHEEREIQRLSAIVINHQLKRLELKLKQFAEVETLLMKECEQVEKARQTLAGERTRALAGKLGPSGAALPINLTGVGPQVVNNTINRPPTLSASTTQPGISGYGGNQISHQQMPFMPRQQMFSFGPRLPLSAIHPSSSGSSSSIMFGAQGSSQSSLNHPILRPISGTSSSMG